MAQGHRFKSGWPSEALSGAPRPHWGRFGRFAKPSRNARYLRKADLKRNALFVRFGSRNYGDRDKGLATVVVVREPIEVPHDPS